METINGRMRTGVLCPVYALQTIHICSVTVCNSNCHEWNTSFLTTETHGLTAFDMQAADDGMMTELHCFIFQHK